MTDRLPPAMERTDRAASLARASFRSRLYVACCSGPSCAFRTRLLPASSSGRMPANNMKGLLKDITETVQRILECPVLPKSGITIASLLLLAILFVFVIILERIFRRHFISRVLRRTHLAPALQFILGRVHNPRTTLSASWRGLKLRRNFVF